MPIEQDNIKVDLREMDLGNTKATDSAAFNSISKLVLCIVLVGDAPERVGIFE